MRKIGFFCAYTPLAAIDAAGFAPFRVFPATDAPDRAGALMHDNMCPHVKRALDRAMAGDLPDLAGVVFMNSCESMRRLADAWRVARPSDACIFVDLPSTADAGAQAFFAGEIRALCARLGEISGTPPSADTVSHSVARLNGLAARLGDLRKAVVSGTVPGGYGRLQGIVNLCATSPVDSAIEAIERAIFGAAPVSAAPRGVPVFLFGNVLPDPAAFEMIERAGCRIVGDDLCTGSRQFEAIEFDESGEPFAQIARGMLARSPCARTVDAARPSMLGDIVAKKAVESGARGVVAHVMKFCDPFLARMPSVREALRARSLPLLVLEGDCSTRSMGQQRTRIEAFAEMLGGAR